MGEGMYAEISRQGAQPLYQEKTGLHCMLYFSGSAPSPSYFTCIIIGPLFVQPSPCDL